MNCTSADIDLVTRVCCGNQSAMDFLANWWAPYVHEIDDMMDGDRQLRRDQLKTFARAAMLFSHPFYLEHLLALRQIVLNVTIMYADSVDWEKSDAEWKKEWADHNRHAGMEMVLAVAMICGGYQHAFDISQEQRSICYHEHHNRQGTPE